MGQLLKPKKTEITDKLRQEINKARAPLALRSRAALGMGNHNHCKQPAALTAVAAVLQLFMWALCEVCRDGTVSWSCRSTCNASRARSSFLHDKADCGSQATQMRPAGRHELWWQGCHLSGSAQVVNRYIDQGTAELVPGVLFIDEVRGSDSGLCTLTDYDLAPSRP